MGVVDDLYGYLESAGVAGGSTEWGLLRRRVMDAPAPDQLVVLTEDGGSQPEIGAEAGIGDSAVKDAGVQVLVRARPWDGDASRAKAGEVFDALHGQRRITLGETQYLRIRAQTPEPVFMGFDEQGRPRHTLSLLFLTDL